MNRTKKPISRQRTGAPKGLPLDGIWLLDLASKPWKNAFTAKIQKLATRWVRCGYIPQAAADAIVSDFAKHYPNFHVPRVAPLQEKRQKKTVLKKRKQIVVKPQKPSTVKPTTVKPPEEPVVPVAAATPIIGPMEPTTTTAIQVPVKRGRGRPRKNPLPVAAQTATAVTPTPPNTPADQENKQ